MTMKKIEKRDGFTLVEMLIVVAIIAVLIMVSVPMFGSTLEKSRVAVDEANERAAQDLAVTAFLTGHDTVDHLLNTGSEVRLVYFIEPDSHQGRITITGVAYPKEWYQYGLSTEEERGFGAGAQMAKPKDRCVMVTMNPNGEITKVEWKTYRDVVGHDP